MRVAVITDGIWPYVIGGMQKHSYFLCKYLAKSGVEVLLVHTAANITDDIKSLSCFNEEERRFIISVVVEKPFVKSFPGHYIYQSFLYSKKIYRILGGFPNVDVIIAKGMTGWFFLRKKKPGFPPIAINIHGYEFLQRKANMRMCLEAMLLRWPLTFINRRADYVFSYGGQITEYILSLGIPRSRIIEASAAIEREWMSDRIAPAETIRNFVFIGRAERRKGIEELGAVIEKMSRIRKFIFHFVGPILPRDEIRLQNVIYHGVVSDREKLKSILQRCQVLVCPSYAEGMPNVILEGMANGCAVIATDVGAVSLLVSDDTGWLIPPANIEELSKAFEEALTISDECLDAKRRVAFEHIKSRFLWSEVSHSLINRIQKVVAS